MLPSFYPSAQEPLLGVFFKSYAALMRDSGWDVRVSYVEPRSFRTMGASALGESHFQRSTAIEDGIPTHRIHGWNPGLRYVAGGRIWSRISARAVLRLVRSASPPDVLHAHNALWGGEAARLVSAETGIPYVVTEHSSHVLMREVPRRGMLFAARVWEESKGVAAVSAALGRVLQDTTGVLPTVIPNPIDTGFFTLPDDAHSSESPRFVTVANLNANKCIDLLIAAFAIVLESSEDALLEIVGTGPEFRSLNALCERLRVGHRVKFLGPLDREGVRATLWRASCFVSASRNETFGIALGEALATGLSVISTRSGGPEELLGDRVGELVPLDDVDELAKAMLRATPPSKAERHMNRQRVLDLCSPSAIGRAYARLYGSAINDLGRRLPR